MSPMCLYMALDTTKIHSPITLGIRPCTKPLVFKGGSAGRVGSIPIARSTLRIGQDP
jgi:hypothetical protein